MGSHSTTRRPGRPRKPQPRDGDSATVQALDRGLLALNHLAAGQPATLAEIARSVDIPAATAHRIMVTLEARGFAKLDPRSGKWEVGPQAYRVGTAYADQLNLAEIAGPILETLMHDTGETSNLAIEDNGALVYLAQIESDNPIRASIKNGAGNLFHTSGIGKAMLAYMDPDRRTGMLPTERLIGQTAKSITSRTDLLAELDRIRQRGWAMDDEERFIGMRCIAAPVFDAEQNVVAGLSISGPAERLQDDALELLARHVCAAARAITSRLENHSAPRPARPAPLRA